MTWQYSPYSLILTISAGVSIFVGISTMRRWAVPGSVSLALFMLAVAEGSIGYAFEYAIVGAASKVICAKIEYLGVTTAPLFFFLFALEYTRKDKLLNTWHMLALWIIPILTLGLAMTNDLHHLIWTTFTPAAHNMLIYGHGLWFWIFGVYSYALAAIATVLLVKAMTRFPKRYRYRITIILVGILLPWISNAAYALGLIPIPGLELTPAAMSMTGIILAYGVFKFELLDLTPVARDVLIEDMNDSLIVLDTQDRIVDINPAACRLFGVDKVPIGEFAPEFLGKWPGLVANYEDTNEVHAEFLFKNEPLTYLDVHISPVADRRKNLVGKLIVLRDITTQKTIEQAERLGRQRLTGILETVPDGIVIVDQSGQITFANPSAEKLLDLSGPGQAGSLYNTSKWKMATPDGNSFPGENHPFEQVIKAGKPVYNIEHTINHIDGRSLTISINAAPLRDAHGSVEEVVITLEDITKRRQAQQIVAQKAEELGILNRINLAITAGLDFDHVLKTLHEQCQQVVPSDAFYVALYEEQTSLIHIPLYYEREYRPGPTLDIHSNPGLTGHIIVSRRTLHLHDTLIETAPAPNSIIRTDGNAPRSYVGIPLFLRDKVIGVMSVQSYQPNAYTDDHIRLLENIAIQAAIAIENARLYGAVQRMAIIDELTAIYNYRGLLELGAREVERARRFNHPLTALFFDVDDFKNFNNLYSHTTGNLVLKSVAACCRAVLRSVDIIARYGGDEFFILLPETDQLTGENVASRLCREISAANISKDGRKLSVTISVGLASLTDDIPDLLNLIDRANQAEHVAKQKGNCVVVWDEKISAPDQENGTFK